MIQRFAGVGEKEVVDEQSVAGVAEKETAGEAEEAVASDKTVGDEQEKEAQEEQEAAASVDKLVEEAHSSDDDVPLKVMQARVVEKLKGKEKESEKEKTPEKKKKSKKTGRQSMRQALQKSLKKNKEKKQAEVQVPGTLIDESEEEIVIEDENVIVTDERMQEEHQVMTEEFHDTAEEFLEATEELLESAEKMILEKVDDAEIDAEAGASSEKAQLEVKDAAEQIAVDEDENMFEEHVVQIADESDFLTTPETRVIPSQAEKTVAEQKPDVAEQTINVEEEKSAADEQRAAGSSANVIDIDDPFDLGDLIDRITGKRPASELLMSDKKKARKEDVKPFGKVLVRTEAIARLETEGFRTQAQPEAYGNLMLRKHCRRRIEELMSYKLSHRDVGAPASLLKFEDWVCTKLEPENLSVLFNVAENRPRIQWLVDAMICEKIKAAELNCVDDRFLPNSGNVSDLDDSDSEWSGVESALRPSVGIPKSSVAKPVITAEHLQNVLSKLDQLSKQVEAQRLPTDATAKIDSMMVQMSVLTDVVEKKQAASDNEKKLGDMIKRTAILQKQLEKRSRDGQVKLADSIARRVSEKAERRLMAFGQGLQLFQEHVLDYVTDLGREYELGALVIDHFVDAANKGEEEVANTPKERENLRNIRLEERRKQEMELRKPARGRLTLTDALKAEFVGKRDSGVEWQKWRHMSYIEGLTKFLTEKFEEASKGAGSSKAGSSKA